MEPTTLTCFVLFLLCSFFFSLARAAQCHSDGCEVPFSPLPASSFLCRCNSGWQGPDCRQNPDECSLGTHNCHAANAACTDTAGSFTCACRAGYVGDGTTCTRISVLWARQVGSVGNEVEGAVAKDEAGRVFLVGVAAGMTDGHATAGGNDVYLAAFNSSTGTKLWSSMLGSVGQDQVYGVAVDGAGSVYVTGHAGSMLGGQTLAGTVDILLSRFDGGNGTVIWTRLLGTAGYDSGHGIAVDRSGTVDAVYITGYTEGTGGGLPGSAGSLGGGGDAFVARYASNGTRMWVRQLGSREDDVLVGLAVHQSEIYAVGHTDGSMAGNASAGGRDVAVVRISALGAGVWTAQLGSAGDDYGRGIAVDSSGVYVAGQAFGSLSGQPFAGGNGDAFVVKYTHAGVWVWTRMLGTSSDDRAYAVALRRSSGVLITGMTVGALGGQFNAGGMDMFVASFSSGGALQWTWVAGTASGDEGYSIAVDDDSGTAYVAGATSGAIFGQPSLGNRDLFLVKLQVACAAGWTGDGLNCSNVNECAAGTHGCHAANASCTDTAGSFTCTCNAGFTGNGIVCAPPVVVPTLQWARQTGSVNSDLTGRVAVDNTGRVFLAAQVAGAVDGLAFSGSPRDMYLVAYNSSTGDKLWAEMLGGSGGDERSYRVAADGGGSVYVTGYTTSSSLDGQMSAGNVEFFLVRYDSFSDTRLWTRLLGGAGNDIGYGVAVDRTDPDAVYVGGSTEMTTGGGLPGSGGGFGGDNDAFVARYARNGTRVWVAQFGTSALDVCNDIAVFQSEIYATGYTNGVMAGAANAGSLDIFVARVTALGAVAWTAQLGSARDDVGVGIAVDGSGVYVTGYGGSLAGQAFAGGNTDAFVARFTHAGALAWARMLGTGVDDYGASVALGQSSNVLITGSTSGALSGQANAGGFDAFVASFTSDGVLQWTRLYGTAAEDYGGSIAVDSSSGATFVAGDTDGSMGGRPSSGARDVFVLKLQ